MIVFLQFPGEIRNKMEMSPEPRIVELLLIAHRLLRSMEHPGWLAYSDMRSAQEVGLGCEAVICMAPQRGCSHF
jgi:hypothetical protein